MREKKDQGNTNIAFKDTLEGRFPYSEIHTY